MLFAKAAPAENLVVRGARVLDPVEGVDAVLDVRVDDGVIAALGTDLDMNAHRVIEGEGLVLAQPYSERPQRFVYELTASGRELAGALRLLADWGARHRESGEPPRHDVCGTPVEARWWCPTCEQPVDEDDAGGLHFA